MIFIINRYNCIKTMVTINILDFYGTVLMRKCICNVYYISDAYCLVYLDNNKIKCTRTD